MQSLIILLDVAAIGAMAWWLYKRQLPTLQRFFWPGLLCKLAAGVGVGLVYFYYYGQGDTIAYWHDGRLVAHRIMDQPMNAISFYLDDQTDLIKGLISEKPRSLFFVKVCGVLSLLSGGNYWMMSAMLSWISFCGAWYLFSKIDRFYPGARTPAAVAFLFYPSVVFWSSGLIKESVGLGAFYLLTGILLSIINLGRIYIWEWILALVSLWFGWTLKYYWVGVFMPVAVTTVIITILKRSNPWVAKFEWTIWCVLFAMVLLLATSVHPNFYPQRFLDVIWQSNNEFMSLTRPDNAIHYANLQPSFLNVLGNAPWALVSAVFRPFVWEFHNLPSLAAGIENLFLLGLVLLSILSLPGDFKRPKQLLFFACMVYIMLLAVFLALAVPNLGTLSRYRIGFLPFLVFFLMQNSIVLKWLRKNPIATDATD